MGEAQVEFDLGRRVVVENDLLDLDTKMSKVFAMLGASSRQRFIDLLGCLTYSIIPS